MTKGIGLEVRGLNFRYAIGEKKVLNNVSFSVHPGDFTGIIGPNGGGKSTLLKLISGLQPVDEGSVHYSLDDEPLKPGDCQSRIAYLPQSFTLPIDFPLTLRDFLVQGLCRSSYSFPWLSALEKKSIEESLERVDLLERAKDRLGELSGGQLKKLLLARAMLSKPGLYLLDEPAAGLDPEAERELYTLLESINKEATILIVSHDLSFVNAHVHSVLCVNQSCHRHETRSLTPEIADRLYRREVVLVDHQGH